MPTIFTLIGESWEFASKQRSLMHIMIWLLFIPTFATSVISRWLDMASADQTDGLVLMGLVLILLLCALMGIWGSLSVIVVGRRLLQSKAGRTRTSFGSVLEQSKKLLFPYLLTSLLRGVTGTLLLFLLIIPGLIYSVRTAVFGIVMVEEGISYRPALQRSSALIKGHSWPVFWKLFGIGVVLFVPIQMLVTILSLLAEESEKLAPLMLIDVIGALLTSIASVLYLLCLILVYRWLKTGTMSGTFER